MIKGNIQYIRYKKLFKELNKTLNELDNMYNINSGGCCYVAYLIACQLDKLNIDYSLSIFESRYSQLDNCEPIDMYNDIKCKDRSSSLLGETHNHYCIKIGRCVLNSSGYSRRNGYLEFEVNNLNHNDIRYLYSIGDWNISYNTNNNSKVIDAINEIFKKYS